MYTHTLTNQPTHQVAHSLTLIRPHYSLPSSLISSLTGLIALSVGSTLLISDVGNDSKHWCHRMMSSKGSFQLSATTTGMAPTLSAWGGEGREGGMGEGMERDGEKHEDGTGRRIQ